MNIEGPKKEFNLHKGKGLKGLPSISMAELEKTMSKNFIKKNILHNQASNKLFCSSNHKEINVCSPFYDRMSTHKPNCVCPFHKRHRSPVIPIRHTEKSYLLNRINNQAKENYTNNSLLKNRNQNRTTDNVSNNKRTHTQNNLEYSRFTRFESNDSFSTSTKVDNYGAFLRLFQYFSLEQEGFNSNKPHSNNHVVRKGVKEIFNFINKNLHLSESEMQAELNQMEKDKKYGDFYIQRFKEMKKMQEKRKQKEAAEKAKLSKKKKKKLSTSTTSDEFNKSLSLMNIADNEVISELDREQLFNELIRFKTDCEEEKSNHILGDRYSTEFLDKMERFIIRELKEFKEEQQEQENDFVNDVNDGFNNNNIITNKEKYSFSFNNNNNNNNNKDDNNNIHNNLSLSSQEKTKYKILNEGLDYIQKIRNNLNKKRRMSKRITFRESLYKEKLLTNIADELSECSEENDEEEEQERKSQYTKSYSILNTNRNSFNNILKDEQSAKELCEQSDLEREESDLLKNHNRDDKDGYDDDEEEEEYESNKKSKEIFISNNSLLEEPVRRSNVEYPLNPIKNGEIVIGEENNNNEHNDDKEDEETIVDNAEKSEEEYRQSERERLRESMTSYKNLRKAEIYLCKMKMAPTIIANEDSILTLKRKARVINNVIKEAKYLTTNQREELNQYVFSIMERCKRSKRRTSQPLLENDINKTSPTPNEETQQHIEISLDAMGYELIFYDLTEKDKLEKTRMNNEDTCIMLNEFNMNKKCIGGEEKYAFKKRTRTRLFIEEEEESVIEQLPEEPRKCKDLLLIQKDLGEIALEEGELLLIDEENYLKPSVKELDSIDIENFLNKNRRLRNVHRNTHCVGVGAYESLAHHRQDKEFSLKLDKNHVKKMLVYAHRKFPNTFEAYLKNTEEKQQLVALEKEKNSFSDCNFLKGKNMKKLSNFFEK